VGLVEVDQLAEIYLERENEYTLAGSIYKGRVTRVLPGMQSAFVDIGLERDAFLYVSDFMELEEHDEDVNDVVPVSRGVQPVRQHSEAPAAPPPAETRTPTEGPSFVIESEGFQEEQSEASAAEESPSDSAVTNDSQEREPRGWRGRRRRRGRRGDRPMPESRYARPTEAPTPHRTSERPSRSDYGPTTGYQPIILPGESISKYQRLRNQPALPAVEERITRAGEVEAPPVASPFPDDEPMFAAASQRPPDQPKDGPDA
jgi:ribonuclease G